MVALGAKVIRGRILDLACTWRKDIVELVNIGMATVKGRRWGGAPPLEGYEEDPRMFQATVRGAAHQLAVTFQQLYSTYSPWPLQ